MRARIALPIVIVSMLIPVLVQAAHRDDPRDPNDARGPLDMRRIDIDRVRVPRFKVITWSGWTTQRIWDRGFGLVWLDTFGTSRFDYYALVRSTGSRLVGDMFRDRERGRDRRLFSVGASKGSRNSFSVRIPLRRLRMPSSRRIYRWEVQTLFVGRRCSRTCFDFVPNQGAIRERNPFATTTTTTTTLPPTTTTTPPTTTTTPPTTTSTTIPVETTAATTTAAPTTP